MRVLGLATYPVEAAATRFRMIQFIEPLAEQGIELSVYPFIDSSLYGSLYNRSQWPRTALGLSLAAVRRVRELVRARNADVVFVQREAMMFGPPLSFFAAKGGPVPLNPSRAAAAPSPV